MNEQIKPVANIGPLYANLASKLSGLEPEYNKQYDQDIDPHYRMLIRASVATWQLHDALGLDADTTDYIWHTMVFDESPTNVLITTQIDAQDCIDHLITMQKERWSEELPLDELEEAVLRRRFGADADALPQSFTDIENTSVYANSLREHGVSAQLVATETLFFLASETLRQNNVREIAPFQSTMTDVAKRAAQIIASTDHGTERAEQLSLWWQEKTNLPIDQHILLNYWKEFKHQQIFNARSHIRSSRVVRVAVLGLAAGVLASRGRTNCRLNEQLGLNESVNTRSMHMLGFRAFKKFVQTREKA